MTPRRGLPLTALLLLSQLLVIGVGFYGLQSWLAREVQPRYREALEEPLVDLARLLAASVPARQGALPAEFPELRRAFGRLHEQKFEARINDYVKRNSNLRVYLADAKGVVVFDSAGRDEGRDFSQWRDVNLTLKGEYGARSTRDDPADALSGVMYVAAPVTDENGRISGSLTVAKPTGQQIFFIEGAQRALRRAVGWAGAAVLLSTAMLSYLILRPVKRIHRYARAVSSGERVAGLPRSRVREMQELGASLESMREALEGRRHAETYVQAFSHELKAPLSAIQAAAEILKEDPPSAERARFLDHIYNETQRMRLLLDRLLNLATIEARRTLISAEPLDLERLCSELSAEFSAAAETRSIELRYAGCRAEGAQASAGGTPRGDAHLIKQAMSGLLQNALDFAPPSSAVSFGIRLRENGATLYVEDGGPGVPAYAIGRVFERFYSLPRPASGKRSSGIGLALAREIADLHGGSARLSNRAPGPGALAEIDLPFAA